MILEVLDLSKTFGGIKAVDGFHAGVDEGDIVGLIGPNGAGKSTVFNCVTGIYRPDSGSIKYKGAELIGFKPHEIAKKGISRTFQNLQLFKDLTTWENILIACHLSIDTGIFSEGFRSRKCCEAEKIARDRTEELIETFGLAQNAHQKMNEVPLGRQKMIEIARVLATDPKLILLDEPVGGLNPEEKNHLVGLIHSIRAKWDLTIFLIEHDMGLVMEICNKVVVMNFGRLIAVGSPEEIKDKDIVIEAYLGKDLDA